MTHQVSFKHMPPRFAAVVRFRARPVELATKMPAAYGEVMAFLSRLPVNVEGPAMARYLPAGEEFDVEAGFYVPNAFNAGNSVTCIELKEEDAAVTTHLGSYETLPAAYEAIHAWAKEQGRDLEESMWEEYWSDPQSTPSSEWRTDVIWPLKPRS